MAGRSDSFNQYAPDAAQKVDPLAEIAKAKGQYTQSQPRTPPAYQWGGHPIKPMAARHIPFPFPTKQAVQVADGGGGGGGGEAKPKQKKTGLAGIFPSEAPPLHPDQAEHERQFKQKWGGEGDGYSPWGGTRDFNDEPVDGIGGSDASGKPVMRPGPRPGGLSGGAAVPMPMPEREPVPARVGGPSPYI